MDSHVFRAIKHVCLALVVLCALGTVPAQADSDYETITAREIDRLFDAMRAKDWKDAETMSTRLLKRQSPGQKFMIARIRYIYIYVQATKIENGLLSYDEAQRILEPLKGKMIIQPWHPIGNIMESCKNMICMHPEDPNILFTDQSNREKNLQYTRELFDTGAAIDLSSYEGKMGRLGGTLTDFTVNRGLKNAKDVPPNVPWYFRLEMSDAFIMHDR